MADSSMKDGYTHASKGSFTIEMKNEKQPGLTIKEDFGSDIHVPDGEVIFIRNICNEYLKRYGARDFYGREVIDKESGNV